jgi:hypothetical protein
MRRSGLIVRAADSIGLIGAIQNITPQKGAYFTPSELGGGKSCTKLAYV